MFGHIFYNDLIRKYVVLFGTLFNDIIIRRPDSQGTELQQLKIPLSYGPKEKFLARTIADPSLDRPFAIDLPRMSFEMTGYRYAGDRHLTTTNRHKATDSSGRTIYQYNPVAYDIDFQLNIMVKNAQDGTRIIEQILPFFTPDWTVTVNLVPPLDIILDIPIVLNTVSSIDTYENNFIERRAIIWTLNFTVKGFLFGPIVTSNTSGSLIKTIIVNMHVPAPGVTIDEAIAANSVPSETITIIPIVQGKTLQEIVATDDYGFSTTIT